MTKYFLYLFTILLFLSQGAYCQYKTVVKGTIKDIESGQSLEYVNIRVDGTTIGTSSDLEGKFEIIVNAEKDIKLIITRVGYKAYNYTIKSFTRGEVQLNVQLVTSSSPLEVVITEERMEKNGQIRQNVDDLKLLPTVSGNLESLLPSIALGTSSGTGGELSSQYNVRGGNYDENLIYVNDFEIFRPQLIRSSQQEGLSFPNIDLTRDLSFSSGGFQSKYGDKLSSVLDIRYKRPEKTKASVSASFLGASAHIEGSEKLGKDNYKKFRYLIGARYKTSQYILNSLEITGEYVPSFVDLQSFMTYDISRSLQLGVILNYNRSKYFFVPDSRTSGAGLVNFALQLSTAYEGQEIDNFEEYMGGISLTWLPDRKKNPYFIKLLASANRDYEDETYDILGYYQLAQIETNLGSDKAGEVVAVLGDGTQHDFARNHLQSTIKNIEIRGGYEIKNYHENPKLSSNHFIEWSVKAQSEDIKDKINEWERIDSAGYSLKYDPEALYLSYVLKSQNQLNSLRYTSFIQNTYTLKRDSVSEWQFNLGLRASYWDLNNEFLIGPRAQLQFRPLNWSHDWAFRLSGGYYY
ncbi:MAG TPA: TonB-dependent receptor, partial [Saprospiraceae bacterium]|nr:TonB-dependent receptor [Saprospiraceae bacterium]